jgi:hypothetical protein
LYHIKSDIDLHHRDLLTDLDPQVVKGDQILNILGALEDLGLMVFLAMDHMVQALMDHMVQALMDHMVQALMDHMVQALMDHILDLALMVLVHVVQCHLSEDLDQWLVLCLQGLLDQDMVLVMESNT